MLIRILSTLALLALLIMPAPAYTQGEPPQIPEGGGGNIIARVGDKEDEGCVIKFYDEICVDVFVLARRDIQGNLVVGVDYKTFLKEPPFEVPHTPDRLRANQFNDRGLLELNRGIATPTITREVSSMLYIANTVWKWCCTRFVLSHLYAVDPRRARTGDDHTLQDYVTETKDKFEIRTVVKDDEVDGTELLDAMRRFAENHSGLESNRCLKIFIAAGYKNPETPNIQGKAFTPGTLSVVAEGVLNPLDDGMTAAHEIGHNLGLNHNDGYVSPRADLLQNVMDPGPNTARRGLRFALQRTTEFEQRITSHRKEQKEWRGREDGPERTRNLNRIREAIEQLEQQTPILEQQITSHRQELRRWHGRKASPERTDKLNSIREAIEQLERQKKGRTAQCRRALDSARPKGFIIPVSEEEKKKKLQEAANLCTRIKELKKAVERDKERPREEAKEGKEAKPPERPEKKEAGRPPYMGPSSKGLKRSIRTLKDERKKWLRHEDDGEKKANLNRIKRALERLGKQLKEAKAAEKMDPEERLKDLRNYRKEVKGQKADRKRRIKLKKINRAIAKLEKQIKKAEAAKQEEPPPPPAEPAEPKRGPKKAPTKQDELDRLRSKYRKICCDRTDLKY